MYALRWCNRDASSYRLYIVIGDGLLVPLESLLAVPPLPGIDGALDTVPSGAKRETGTGATGARPARRPLPAGEVLLVVVLKMARL